MARNKIPEVIAAVDLGSNSFHMVVARLSHGQLVILDRLREPVRLAAGLDEHERLDRDASDRALACLERFGQRLRDMKAESVRVIGTNTLRKAKKRGAFLDRARSALGHPIEIVSGIEEARLVYMGVLNTMPSDSGRRLVVDIGGGSTELIVGEGKVPKQLESLQLGCVALSTQLFADGALTEKRFKRARLSARVELEPVSAAFRQAGWDGAIGTSGTIRSIHDVIKNQIASDAAITPEHVERVIELAMQAGHIDSLNWPEMSTDRRAVFPGGVAILAEVLHALEIKSMRAADGALREGILYDLVGRFTNEDARVRSVRAMSARFHVDVAQADRVESAALSFLHQVREVWRLDDPDCDQVLAWAARLHEVGLDVSHSRYHKHGGYLLEHADMPGFPQEEQRILATLVRSHRRRLNLQELQELPAPWHQRAEFLIVLLRLAVLLHRSRTSTAVPDIRLQARSRTLTIEFPRGWLSDHPLTQADLEQERQYLAEVGFRLREG